MEYTSAIFPPQPHTEIILYLFVIRRGVDNTSNHSIV